MKYKTCKPYLIINSCPHEVRLRKLHRHHLAVGSALHFTEDFGYNVLRLEVDKPISIQIEIEKGLISGLGLWDAMPRTTLMYVYTILNLIRR